ncbi:MAG: ferrochelatase [Chromatiales bacterium]|jgi:ferrochelatase
MNTQDDTTPPFGVLLVNLGTPDAPDTASVRRYLAEFLSDPRVIEAPRVIWWPVLHGVILRVRPRRSAAAYREVWTEDGSPLLSISKRQRPALERALAERTGHRIPVVLAMRYGTPSIEQGLSALRDAGIARILVLPLYPQYSATTTASIFDRVTEVLRGWRVLPELRFINRYPDHPAYIRALAGSVRDFQAEHGRPERLLLSFHGIPREYADKGDPYPDDCERTARALARELGLADDDWLMTFQSRFGPKEWLKPYTDQTLKAWGAGGVKRVQVICPGFPTDCLETIEEVGAENREYFMEAGGEDYRYIPSLNDSPAHMEALVDLIGEHVTGWLPERKAGTGGRESPA